MRGWTILAKSHFSVSHENNDSKSEQIWCKLTRLAQGNTEDYLNNDEKVIEQQLCGESVSPAGRQLTGEREAGRTGSVGYGAETAALCGSSDCLRGLKSAVF